MNASLTDLKASGLLTGYKALVHHYSPPYCSWWNVGVVFLVPEDLDEQVDMKNFPSFKAWEESMRERFVELLSDTFDDE